MTGFTATRRPLAGILSASLLAATAAVGVFGSSAGAVTVPLHPLGALKPTTRVTATAIPAAVGAPSVPASVDLSAWAMPVGQQGNVNSCVAWAIDYAMLGWYSNHDGKPGAPFAPMYTYSQVRVLNAAGNEVGSRPRDVLNIALNQGNDVRADYPQADSDWRTTPTLAQVVSAASWKITGFHQLFAGSQQGTNGSDQIKSALAAGKPVALTIPVRPGFDNMGNTSSALDNDTTGTSRGDHEVLALGYDSNGVLVQNSFGTEWGNQGYGRLSWNVIGNDVSEANTIDGFKNSPKTDLVALNNNSTYVMTSTGSSFSSPVKWAGVASYGSVANLTGDVSGDGRADLIAWNSADTWVMTAKAIGNGFNAPTRWSSGAFSGNRTNTIGDVNRDGRADLIAWNNSDTYVMTSTGTGFNLPVRWSSGAFYGTRTNAVGDMDGDGRADLIAWNNSDTYVMTSTGTGFRAPVRWSAGAFSGTRTNAVGDVNGDGRADLIAWNDSDTYVMTSAGAWFSPPVRWSSGAFYGEKANLNADVTGLS